jgi:prepilin-type N-terminal cleavage/methylation domain-containing protein
MKFFRPNNQKAGFTLVEIMIVVLIIGILLAIAIPNFVAARESSRAKACVGNLKQIDSAKQQSAMDNKLSGTSTATFVIDGTTVSSGTTYQLVGTNGYIRSQPSCPSTGVYTPAGVSAIPTCSISGSTTTGNYGWAGGTATPGVDYHGLTN